MTLTFEDITDEIALRLSQSDIDYLRKLSPADLDSLHHGWGTNIRNEYQLWAPDCPFTQLTEHWHKFPNERNIVEGVDYSVDHPDAVSMRIMKEVHRKVQP